MFPRNVPRLSRSSTGSARFPIRNLPNSFFRQRRRRRAYQRASASGSLLKYTAIFQLSKSSVTSFVTAQSLGLPTDRICRCKWIRLTYSAPANNGLGLSFTIESQTSDNDAVSRSPGLVFGPIPRSHTLRCPASTDWAYITSTSNISDVSVYDPTGTTRELPTFYCMTVCFEFKNAQPHTAVITSMPLTSLISTGCSPRTSITGTCITHPSTSGAPSSAQTHERSTVADHPTSPMDFVFVEHSNDTIIESRPLVPPSVPS